MKLLIVGCGYVGRAVAARILHQSQGELGRCDSASVYALTRSAESADELSQLGVHPILGHWLDRKSLPVDIWTFSHLLIAVPHRADSTANLSSDNDDYHAVGLSNLREWLTLNSPGASKFHPPKLVYLSTTGVYGPTAPGQTVDEQTPIDPSRIGGRIAASAERWLWSNHPQWASITLRLAGIYGPGRIPLLEKMRLGLPLEVDRMGRLNLIHLDDIVSAILWSLASEPASRLYVLSDNHPVKREQFYRHLANMQGIAEPKFIDPSSDDRRSLRASDKVVDSSKFWSESHLLPKHPNYRSGLNWVAHS